MNRFSNNLYHMRVKAGMSQKELADKLYISNKTISKWERGVSEPDLQMLSAVAECFNVSIDDLVTKNPDAEDLAKEPPQKDESLFKKAVALCVALVAGYIVSVVLYCTVGTVYNYVNVGKVVGMCIYFATAVGCCVAAYRHFTSFGLIARKAADRSLKREFLCTLFMFSGLLLFTLGVTILGMYDIFSIVRNVESLFALALLIGIALAKPLIETYIYLAYRGVENTVRTDGGVTAIQWCCSIPFLIVLTIIYSKSIENGTEALLYVLYSLFAAGALVAPFVYIAVRRTGFQKPMTIINYVVNVATCAMLAPIPYLLICENNDSAAITLSATALAATVIFGLIKCIRLKIKAEDEDIKR